jgi:2-iminobutanoate/2-iminopropanoate deaminase
MKKIITTDKAPKAIGPYSQAVEMNGTVYVSGQVPVNPSKGQIDQFDISGQTEQVLKNIGNILKSEGCTYSDVVKTTVFLSDLANFNAMNEVYSKYFTTDPPARSTVQVSGLPLGALVEIESVAVRSFIQKQSRT